MNEMSNNVAFAAAPASTSASVENSTSFSEPVTNATTINNSSDLKKEETEEYLPFARAEVIRLMKENLDDDKMIRERVKVEMNKFLGEILKDICKQLNEYPYSTVDYEMLKECLYPYQNIKRINQEKERILLHLDAIKSDCTALQADVSKTLKLKDTKDEERLF